MYKYISTCFFIICITGCISSELKIKPQYDSTRDVSPVEIQSRYKPEPLDTDNMPFDSVMAMSAVAHMVRGETPHIDRLVVSSGMDLTEPGNPLEHFNFVDLTILDRIEAETIQGKTWETKTMAVLTFTLGPLKALVVAEVFCTVTREVVHLTGASVRTLSPAQPRVAAWFVPKKLFLDTIQSDEELPVWEIMALANSMAVRVGPGLPQTGEDHLAVAIVLDRLEVEDKVEGWVSANPMPEGFLKASASVYGGIGFPVLMSNVDSPLNVKPEELFMHVTWTPADTSRSNGHEVPVGRFSTCGSVFRSKEAPEVIATPPAATIVKGPLESGKLFLNPKDKNEAILIQRRLSELGIYTGAIDGIFGKGSRTALARYKKNAGLGNDSNWDLPTQKALFSDTGQ